MFNFSLSLLCQNKNVQALMGSTIKINLPGNNHVKNRKSTLACQSVFCLSPKEDIFITKKDCDSVFFNLHKHSSDIFSVHHRAAKPLSQLCNLPAAKAKHIQDYFSSYVKVHVYYTLQTCFEMFSLQALEGQILAVNESQDSHSTRKMKFKRHLI